MDYKYTDAQLARRGYIRHETPDIPLSTTMIEIATGRFGNVIQLLQSFSSNGHFDPASISITSGTPSEVVEFIQNYMMQPVSAYSADGANALSRIIPRSVGDASSLGQYLEYFETELSKIVVDTPPE